ncbi:hypothetical protein [Methylobacterium haplocladii]|uniref:hypothetical protein n=1 Tax=Methylobacterium haplocladii TaxID=1176176 RepID=UPI0011BD677C|nr:hypothetical protein [Methylobacterium haplocladii]GJD82988.1 hypothetical protein HPGCJGGD_0850 [Methylobacterium haplocladii]
MPIGFREKVVAGIVLAIGAIAMARHASTRPPADPCETDPGAYACAMFAQPEWLKRRVYAGRMVARSEPAPAPVATVDAIAISADVPELGADGI